MTARYNTKTSLARLVKIGEILAEGPQRTDLIAQRLAISPGVTARLLSHMARKGQAHKRDPRMFSQHAVWEAGDAPPSMVLIPAESDLLPVTRPVIPSHCVRFLDARRDPLVAALFGPAPVKEAA